MIRINIKNGKKDYDTGKNMFEKICSYGVTIIALIMFGFVAISSIFMTSVIDPENFGAEKILYQRDQVLINILLILLFFGLAFIYYHYKAVFGNVSERTLIVGLAIYTIVVGFVWIIKVQSIPAADSGTVYNTAVSIIKGDWSPFFTSTDKSLRGLSYYQLYPFQLGLVFISEVIYRVLGYETALPLQLVNVLALALLYVGLQKIAQRIFRSKGVLFLLTLFLAGCLQPIFFTTFAYGNLIGFSAAVWSCYFIIRFMQSENAKRALFFIPASLLMALAIIAKYNNMIWLVAMVIGLFIYIVKNKKWLYLLYVLGFSVVAVTGLNLVIMSYEIRSEVEFGNGVSQLLYLDMGLNESSMAPGWYNGMAKRIFLDHGGDIQAANEEAKKDLSLRKEKFLSDGGYTAKFFVQKIVSQWNEPTYESIWVSQVKNHYYGKVEEWSWLDKVYNGTWGQKLNTYFNLYHMMVFVLFSIAMIALMIKKCSAETMMLILTLIGGFIYHLLFEAKSQYSITYFILIVFFAAYGLHFVLKSVSFKLKK